MTKTADLIVDPQTLGKPVQRDPRVVSYNIEMTEVTGGTFWKPYTSAQIAGTEEVEKFQLPEGGLDAIDPSSIDVSALLGDTNKLMSWRNPIDLNDTRIRSLASSIGPSWVRVSGSWATNTYYDFDGHTGGVAPQGYRAVLTLEQWQGVLDFVRAVDGKLLTSFAVIPGREGGSWDPEQVRLLLDTSAEYGVPVSAVEFVNEPNISFTSEYTRMQYAVDEDDFYAFMRSEYPDVLLVGPSSAGETFGGGIDESLVERFVAPTVDMVLGTYESPDIFSYHSYVGISERTGGLVPRWSAEDAVSDEYLAMHSVSRRFYEPVRDIWCPSAPLWVTETADAGAGGDTWASTYLDVIRMADELGGFSEAAEGVIFHNTLASSDYGLLDENSHAPRPNWWFLWLWRMLAGSEVLPGAANERAAHVYARTRADGCDGACYLVINNSLTESLLVETTRPTSVYTLSAAGAPTDGSALTVGDIRSAGICLNGELLSLGQDNALPAVVPVEAAPGLVELAPATVTFLVL